MKKAGITEKTIRANAIEIATEAFGDTRHPPMLLIMGAMASMLWWPDGFCRLVAAEKRYVIRYDNRDTGLSTTWEPGRPGYTSDDMIDDVVRVLDGYGLSAAHLVGMSMGGAIAQLAALAHAGRVLSLTVISTSPVGLDTSHLPGSTEAYAKHSADGESVDWSDREAVIGFMIKDMRMLAAPTLPFHEAAARRFVERDYDRAKRFASATNHFLLQVGEQRQPKLRDLKAPLLVVHGTDDPLFPIEHADASVQAVAGAKLLRLEGGGHGLHEAYWPQIMTAIVEHTGNNT